MEKGRAGQGYLGRHEEGGVGSRELAAFSGEPPPSPRLLRSMRQGPALCLTILWPALDLPYRLSSTPTIVEEAPFLTAWAGLASHLLLLSEKENKEC